MTRNYRISTRYSILARVTERSSESDFTNMSDWNAYSRWLDELDIRSNFVTLNAFHKNIVEKNNHAKTETERIFDGAVETADTYKTKMTDVKTSIDNYRAAIQALSDTIDPSKGLFTSAYIAGTLYESLSEYELTDTLLREISEETYKYYRDQMKNEDGSYNFDYIEELMNSDPDEIPDEAYVALIDIFNEMSIEDKERFVSRSYIVETTETGSPARWSISDGTTVYSYYKYTISPVYVKMVNGWGTIISNSRYYNDEDGLIASYYGNYSLAKAFERYASEFYSLNDNPIISINVVKDINHNTNDIKRYTIDITAYDRLILPLNNPNEKLDVYPYGGEMISINVYGMEATETLNGIFVDESNQDIKREFKKDYDASTMNKVASAGYGILKSFVKIPGKMSDVLGFGETFVNTATDIFVDRIKTEQTNSAADNIIQQNLIPLYYSAIDATIAFSTSGTECEIVAVQLNRYAKGPVEKEIFQEKINYYNENCTNYDPLPEDFYDNVIANITDPSALKNIPGFENFYRWYMIDGWNGDFKNYIAAG